MCIEGATERRRHVFLTYYRMCTARRSFGSKEDHLR